MRRHMNKGQCAIAAAKLKSYYASKAQERKAANGGDRKSEVANFPPPIADQGKARDKAAADFGVSGRTVDDAVTVGAGHLIFQMSGGGWPSHIRAYCACAAMIRPTA